MAGMLTVDKHLIPLTGADRYNYNFIISGKPRGGTSRFEMYTTMQAISEERLPAVAVVRLTDDTAKIEFVRNYSQNQRR